MHGNPSFHFSILLFQYNGLKISTSCPQEPFFKIPCICDSGEVRRRIIVRGDGVNGAEPEAGIPMGNEPRADIFCDALHS